MNTEKNNKENKNDTHLEINSRQSQVNIKDVRIPIKPNENKK